VRTAIAITKRLRANQGRVPQFPAAPESKVGIGVRKAFLTYYVGILLYRTLLVQKNCDGYSWDRSLDSLPNQAFTLTTSGADAIDPLVTKQPPKCYLIDSLSLALPQAVLLCGLSA
jgi:hypothetical protein